MPETTDDTRADHPFIIFMGTINGLLKTIHSIDGWPADMSKRQRSLAARTLRTVSTLALRKADKIEDDR